MLVTRLCTFCTIMFNNNNIKVVIKMHAFQFYPDRNKCRHIKRRSLKYTILKTSCNSFIIKTTLDSDTYAIIGCFFLNSGTYDLAFIQSFFDIFEIGRIFFHSIHRRIFNNAKNFIDRTNLSLKNLYFILWWILSNQINT